MKTRSYTKKMLEDINEKGIPTLPTDILMTIFSLLSDHNDIKNCMLLSKEIRWEIFRTKKIVKNLVMKLEPLSKARTKVTEFVTKYGRYIINLKIPAFPFMSFLFSQMPNLEQLNLVDKYELPTPFNYEYKELPKLPKLKSLKIGSDCLHELVWNTDITLLENLKVSCFNHLDLKVLQNFMNRQKNLKKFKVRESDDSKIVVKNSFDLSNVKFQLKCLKLYINEENVEKIVSILNSQTEHLEELCLELSKYIVSEDLAMCLTKFKKLEKFEFFAKGYDGFKAFPFFELKTVKHMECWMETAFRRAPNLEYYKCDYFDYCLNGTFDKLITLEVNHICIPEIKEAKFPNFKNLILAKIVFYVDVEEEWNIFAESIPNVENIHIEQPVKCNMRNCIEVIFENLKRFEKLKTFFYRSENNQVIKMEENEIISATKKFDKVLIYVEKKKIYISSYIVKNKKEIFINLVKNFEGFQFIEFCFNVLKEEVIDPAVLDDLLKSKKPKAKRRKVKRV